MDHFRRQSERFGTRILHGDVRQVDFSARPFRLELDDRTLLAKTLIIASGASARLLGLPSEKKLMGRGVSACATCDGFFFKGQEIAVVGGGDTAMEEAIYLSKLATQVTVIHRRAELRASKVMQAKAFATPNISFLWNTEVVDIRDADKGEVTALVLRNTLTGERSDLPVDGLFIGIGHTPNTALFKGQLALEENGYVKTHAGSRTSVPGVFAAGDVQDHVYRQAVTAAGSGCMAAMDAERYLSGVAHEAAAAVRS
jgi:thioredoxin reductase (NADPH)